MSLLEHKENYGSTIFYETSLAVGFDKQDRVNEDQSASDPSRVDLRDLATAKGVPTAWQSLTFIRFSRVVAAARKVFPEQKYSIASIEHCSRQIHQCTHFCCDGRPSLLSALLTLMKEFSVFFFLVLSSLP